MTLYETLSLILAALGGIFIIIQSSIALRAYKAEHERQCKQATIEHIREIRSVYRVATTKIDRQIGKDILTEAMVDDLEEDSDTLEALKELLSVLELTSVGINTGVFDKELWRRVSGAFLIRIYRRFHAYIKHAQKRQPTIYIEFEEVAREFEERKRQKPDEKGKIRYS